MKSFSVKSKVIFLVIGFAFFACVEARGADWKYLGQSGDRVFYYYAESVTRPSKDVVRVWGKADYTEKGIMGMVERFGSRYENLKYSLDLWELKCANNTIRILATTHHSKNGEVLDSKKNDHAKWKSIAPGSVEDSLHKAVCK